MRKRSGALHSNNQDELLKQAEEQQQQQNFKGKHLRRVARGPNLQCYNKEYDKNIRGSQYGLIPFIEFERRRGSSLSELEASREFEENKGYENKIVDVMLLCQFGSNFMTAISQLDSFDNSQGWCAGQMKDKMLDLIIATEKQSNNNDKESQIVFKIWMHNSLSCQNSSVHTQIIEQIHYSRCSFFIFLFEENIIHDILQCYERVKQIKGNMFKGAFIVIKSEIQSQTNNLTLEQLVAFKNLKSNLGNLSHFISFQEIDSKNVAEQLRSILKGAYAEQENKRNVTYNQDELLENTTPVSASTNKTRSSSNKSGNSCNSSNASEGTETLTNNKDNFQQNSLVDMQIDNKQDSQNLGLSQQNTNQQEEIQQNCGSNKGQFHEQQQNIQNGKNNINKLHPCKLKGSKSEDFVKLAEPVVVSEQQEMLNTGVKHLTRSFSYHCSSLCLKNNNKKKNISQDFNQNIQDFFNIQKQNIFSQSHSIPREVTFNSSQH